MIREFWATDAETLDLLKLVEEWERERDFARFADACGDEDATLVPRAPADRSAKA